MSDAEREPGFYWIKIRYQGQNTDWTLGAWGDDDTWLASFDCEGILTKGAELHLPLYLQHIVVEVGPRILPPEE